MALCCAAFVTAGLVSDLVLERVPHLEDEVAYLFQAQVFAGGKAHAEAPFDASCFFAPFVVDYEGRRFGKYPPGWPALLAAGVALGQAWWVNAAGAALTIALVYRLGRAMHGPLVGLIGAALAASSPFVLLLAGSLMSHTWSLVFVTAYLWCYYRARKRERNPDGWALGAGAALGAAFAIRPFTALAIGLPAAIEVGRRLVTRREWRLAWFAALGSVPLALAVPVFNALWTGDPMQSAYRLVWPYDRIGFGPGTGPAPGGNTVWLGLSGSLAAVGHLANHLLGWPTQSLSFAVLLFLFRPRKRWDRFLGWTSLSLVFAYAFYWTSGDVFGPRYAYESSSALFVLSAAGIARVGEWMRKRDKLWILASLLLVLLVANLGLYLPHQLSAYRGLYGISSASRDVVTEAGLRHALVIVKEERGWWDYAVLFALNKPGLGGDVVYASDCGAKNDELVARYPGRQVYTFDSATMSLVAGGPP
jgi:4-amino-4-deoxy-L-arabinose transferase-like glycosyltransferase